jgi:hypothetical protein
MAPTQNGIIGRAIALLRRPGRQIGYTNDEANLLRRAGRELLDTISDEDLNAEMERRARGRLLDIGMTERKNVRPPRPKTALTPKIRERKAKEKGLKVEMLESKAAWEAARAELVKAQRAHPADASREEGARRQLQDALFAWRRAESDWRRCRSGRHALQLAEDRLLADIETERSQERRRARR